MGEIIKKTNNPWKGLQSYQENDVIYGRDEEIKSLYTRILYNTQTVVYGKSGIGKSSIINAGITPRAKHDEMLPIVIRLAHTTKNDQIPTSPYIEQVFNRIKEEIQKVGGEIEEIVSHVPNHTETLWELMHRIKLWVGKDGSRKRLTPLLLFDQFEEIFTLEIDNKRVESFFAELADLLNEIKPTYLTPTESDETAKDALSKVEGKEKTRNVFSKIANRKRNETPDYMEKSEFHLVITLREDFLSYLERYTAYIPVMKQNRFPLLPLNEEQAAKIITEPIKDLIQLDVAEMIIQRVTGRDDFKLDGIPEIEVDAALLSLYMEQLYERKGDENNIISSELVQFNDDIIKKFYENSIEGTSEKTIEYLEDELITNANRRNNVARVDLISGGVLEIDLDKLIDKKVLRQFSYGGDLRIEFIHDILCPIVNDRIEHREQLAKEREAERKKKEDDERRERERLQQEEKLRKAEEEKQILLRKQQLQEEENLLLKHKQEEELARAERERQLQQEQFERAEKERKLLLRQQELQEEENKMLLRKQEEERIRQEKERKELEEKAAAEKEAMERKALRIKKRNRRYFIGVAVVLLYIIGYFLYDYYQNDLLFEEYYEGYVLENGWPKGVGEKMSKQDAYRLTVSYRLWKNGASTEHFNNVSVYGRGGQQSMAHTPINSIVICEDDIDGGDINASKTAIMLAKTHYIYFRQDSENNEPVQQLCYDKDGHDKTLLYTINLSKEGDVVWMVFCDSVGRPFSMRDNGADRLKVLRSKNGLDSICYIFDGLGIPQHNTTHYYGQEFVYNNVFRLDTIFFLDQFGLRRKASTYTYPSSQSVLEKVDSITSNGIEPLFMILWSYDKHGDCVKKEYSDLSDKLFQKCDFKYDDWGRLVFRSQYDARNNQTTELQISYMGNENYDIKEKTLKRGHGTSPSSWETISFYRTNVIQNTKHIEQQDEMGNYSHQIIKQIDSETEEIRFVNLQGQPIIDPVEVCHRKVTRIHHNNDGSYYQTEYYYGLDGNTLYSTDDYPYAVDSMVCDSYGHRLARVRWDKDMNIITSYRIEYKGGRESFRYAMGVEGNPIRCPHWECEGLNYYKLQTIRKSDGKTLVYLRAIDEYGLPCILYNGFRTKGTYVTNNKREMGMGWSEIRTDSIRIPDIPKNATSICYLHILNKDGEAYRQGLKDGDILVYKEGTKYRLSSINGRMNLNDFIGGHLFYVIRFNPDIKKWSTHEVQIHNGQISGAEVYPIYYSQEEMIIINKALSQLN